MRFACGGNFTREVYESSARKDRVRRCSRFRLPPHPRIVIDESRLALLGRVGHALTGHTLIRHALTGHTLIRHALIVVSVPSSIRASSIAVMVFAVMAIAI